MRIQYLFLLFVPLVLALVLRGGEGAYPRAELLAEPTQLSKRSMARQYVILDARERQRYDQGHVPGAYWVDRAAWAGSFGHGEDAAGWSRRIGALGIGPQSRVIVYADNCRDAAQVWWLLRYWGVDDVKLLNGGWTGWTASAGSIERRACLPAPSKFDAQGRPGRLATREQLRKSLAGGALQIVDTRTEPEYRGVEKLRNKCAGAIPGAKHLEWVELLDPQTQRFKSATDMRRLFNLEGIVLDQPTVTYCQAGARSAVMAFGLELMGSKNVSNYYAGWNEWANSETEISCPE